MSATPGPWQVVADDDGLYILMEANAGKDAYLAVYASENPEQREADANLIAAAPEMDDALDKLIFELDSITWDSQGPPPTLVDALEDARAVRAKARGES